MGDYHTGSMRVLIDGHNALGRLRLRGRTHEEKRAALLRRVASMGVHATVFFDAQQAPPGIPRSRREQGVQTVYCREREADKEILAAVRAAAEPRRLVIVTDDREVAGRCAQLGAQVLAVEHFFGPRGREGGPAPRPPRTLPRFEPGDFGLPESVDLERDRLDDDE